MREESKACKNQPPIKLPLSTISHHIIVDCLLDKSKRGEGDRKAGEIIQNVTPKAQLKGRGETKCGV